MISDLFDGHEHVCAYPLIADPPWNHTPSPSSTLPDTYWPETPCRCEARILTFLSQKVPHPPVRPWSINIRTLCFGIFLFILWVVSCTISISFQITIVPNSVHCSSSIPSPCSTRAGDGYAVLDIVRLDGVFELASLIRWPSKVSLVCGQFFLSDFLIRFLRLWAESRNRYFLTEK